MSDPTQSSTFIDESDGEPIDQSVTGISAEEAGLLEDSDAATAAAEELAEDDLRIFDEAASKANIDIGDDKGIIDGTPKKLVGHTPLVILNVPKHRMEKLFERLNDNAKFLGTKEQRDQFIDDLSRGASTAGDGIMDKTLYRDGAEWARHINSPSGRKIAASVPNLTARKGVGPGEKVAARINQSFGLGRTIQQPLWQTGIWLTLKAPLLGDELELDRRIAADRVLLGRQTYGRSFTNDSVITNRVLVDFILRHVVDVSTQGLTFEELLHYIKLPDLHAMALGLASAIHVHGYPFRQPCITNIETCTHVEKATLNLPKLYWVDRKRVTPRQLQIMGKFGSKVSVEELKAYQDEISAGAAESMKLNESFTIVFKTPSIAEHFDVGEAWVNDLTAAADIAFGTTMSTQERNTYLLQRANLSRLRSHSHWIAKIVEIVDTPSGEMEEEHLPGSGLEAILEQLSSDSDIVEAIVDGISEYYSAVFLAVVGIPNYDCPACGAWHTDMRGKVHALHAIDPVSVFFQTQQFRLEAAQTLES